MRLVQDETGIRWDWNMPPVPLSHCVPIRRDWNTLALGHTALGHTAPASVSMQSHYGPIHTPHAVADLNQSETRNVAIFSADFCLTHWYHKQRLGTQCGFVAFGSVALTQQNGCMGAYRVIDLEQFPVRISTDKAPTPLTKFGICSFFFFFFCQSLLSFFLCIAMSDSRRFSPF